MPLYSYEDTNTGETWDEVRSYEEREKDLPEGVVLLPCTTILGDPSIHTRSARKIEREFGTVLDQVRKTHRGTKW